MVSEFREAKFCRSFTDGCTAREIDSGTKIKPLIVGVEELLGTARLGGCCTPLTGPGRPGGIPLGPVLDSGWCEGLAPAGDGSSSIWIADKAAAISSEKSIEPAAVFETVSSCAVGSSKGTSMMEGYCRKGYDGKGEC